MVRSLSSWYICHTQFSSLFEWTMSKSRARLRGSVNRFVVLFMLQEDFIAPLLWLFHSRLMFIYFYVCECVYTKYPLRRRQRWLWWWRQRILHSRSLTKKKRGVKLKGYYIFLKGFFFFFSSVHTWEIKLDRLK